MVSICKVTQITCQMIRIIRKTKTIKFTLCTDFSVVDEQKGLPQIRRLLFMVVRLFTECDAAMPYVERPAREVCHGCGPGPCGEPRGGRRRSRFFLNFSSKQREIAGRCLKGYEVRIEEEAQ